MEFTANRNDLAEAVTNAANGIPATPVIPIRAGMEIFVSPEFARFTGGDGDISFSSVIRADVTEPLNDVAEAVVAGKLFADVIKSLPDHDVHIVTDGKAVHINCGNCYFKLPEYKDPYPVDKHEDIEILGTVPGNDLTEAILKVAPAVSKNDANPRFTGMLLDVEGDVLVTAASSPYRMAVCDSRWEPKVQAKSTCLVPGWVMDRFRRGINSDVVQIGWNDSTVVLKSEVFEGNSKQKGFTMTARQLASEFPEWRKFFPSVPTVQIDAEELAAVVKRAKLAIFSDASPLELFFSNDLYVEAGLEERFSEVLPCPYTGKDYRALVGSQLFLDAITACEGESFLGFTGEEKKPMQITSGNYRSVIVTRRPQ